jgi:hypothetical protein
MCVGVDILDVGVTREVSNQLQKKVYKSFLSRASRRLQDLCFIREFPGFDRFSSDKSNINIRSVTGLVE